MQDTNRSGYKIIKVPMGPGDFVPNRPPAFPRQPNLYLELLENKEKIQQEKVNQDYRPKNQVKSVPFIEQDHPRMKPQKNASPFSDNANTREEPPQVDYPDNLSDFSDTNSDVGEAVDNLSDVIDDLSDVEDRDDRRGDRDRDYQRKNDRSPVLPPINANLDVEDLSDAGSESYEPGESRYENGSYEEPQNVRGSPRDEIARNLGGDDSPRAESGGHVGGGNNQPPTLSQLESGHGRGYIPDAGQPSSLSAEELHQKKQDLLDKFYTLKMKYKGATDIPEFTIHSDYATMERSYERTVRRLKIDSKIAWYSQMITYVFVGIEWFCSTIFKIDMSGYTQHQTLNKDSYESLLVELGERSYMPTKWNIPVELKLVGLILMNTALFIFSKIMMKKMGVNMLSVNTNTLPTGNGGKKSPPKTMKEPDFDLGDLPV